VSPDEQAVLRSAKAVLWSNPKAAEDLIDVLLAGGITADTRSRKAKNQAAYRDRVRQRNGNTSDNGSATLAVTSGNVSGNETVTPTIRADHDLRSSLVSSGSPSLSASLSFIPSKDATLSTGAGSAKQARKAKRTVIAPDWAPSQATLEAFRADGFDALPCVTEFVDHWRGTGDLKADWEATFRNRVRDLIRFGRCPRVGAKPAAQESAESSYEELHNSGKWRRVMVDGKLVRSEPLDERAREAAQGEQQSLLGHERR
jgi:hypothetical protein